jgi:hypothetical protein
MSKRLVLLLVAVVMLASACTKSTSGKPSAITSSAAPSSAGFPSQSSAPSSAAPSSSAPTSSGVASDWWKHVDFATLSHPDMNCAPAGLGGKIDVVKVVAADVTGDGLPEAIVRLECAHSASEWPDSVYVYGDASGTPSLLATLLKQSGSSYATSISPGAKAVTLGTATWSSYAPGCCTDLNYTQTFTWDGTSFTPGPKQDVVKACGDTAFAISAANPQGATGHGSVVLLFKNRLPQACTLNGYPGLDALDAGGNTLAHATRTMNGFAGGAHHLLALTVAPGATVSALAEWMNFNPQGGGSCQTSSQIATTPPNTTDTVTLNVALSVCDLQIHPVVPGTSGDN